MTDSMIAKARAIHVRLVAWPNPQAKLWNMQQHVPFDARGFDISDGMWCQNTIQNVGVLLKSASELQYFSGAGTHLGAADTQLLVEALCHNRVMRHTLKYLDMESMTLSRPCATTLFATLRAWMALEGATFTLRDPSETVISELAKWLQTPSVHLLSFGLPKSSLRHGFAGLAPALASHPYITTLNLCGCGLEASHMQDLAQVVRANRVVERLNLSGNTFHHVAMGILCPALAGNHAIRELAMELCDIGAEGMGHLMNTLCANRTLQRLNIRKNHPLYHSVFDMMGEMLWKHNTTVLEMQGPVLAGSLRLRKSHRI